MGRSDDYPVKLSTAFGGVELKAVNAERVMLQVGIPVNVDDRLEPLEVNGVRYHGSAMLHAGSERGPGNEGAGWSSRHNYVEHRQGYAGGDRLVSSDGLYFSREGSFSSGDITPAAVKKLRPELERVVTEWSQTEEGRAYLEQAQAAWTASELRMNGLERIYTDRGEAWESLAKAWDNYATAAARAGVDVGAVELAAARVADHIEDEATPNVLALAVLAALTVKQRADAGAYSTPSTPSGTVKASA